MTTIQDCCCASFSSSCNVFCAASQSGLCAYTLSNVSTSTKKISFSTPFQHMRHVDAHSCPAAVASQCDFINKAESLSLHSTSTKIIGRVWREKDVVSSSPVHSVTTVGESSLLVLVYSDMDGVREAERSNPSGQQERDSHSTTTMEGEKAQQKVNYHAEISNGVSSTGVPRMRRAGRSQFAYIYDAFTNTFLAELYFGGSPIHCVHANAHLIIATTVDALHVVELRTLRHVSQHILNRESPDKSTILTLSQEHAPPSVLSPCTTEQVFSNHTASANTSHQAVLHSSNVCERAVTVTYRIAYAPCEGSIGDIQLLTCLLSSPSLISSFSTSVCCMNISKAFHHPGSKELFDTHDSRKDRLRSCTPYEVQSIEAHTIAAHSCPIAALALNQDGSLLASVSTHGSTVKLFFTQSGQLIKEYQRGYRRAAIYSLALNANGSLLAALSSTGTVHLFGTHAALYAAKQHSIYSCGGTSRNVSDIDYSTWKATSSLRHVITAVSVCADKPRAVLKKKLFSLPGTTMMRRSCLSWLEDSVVHRTTMAVSRLRQHYIKTPPSANSPTMCEDELQSTLPSPALGWTYAMQFACDGRRLWVAQLGPQMNSVSLGGSPVDVNSSKQGTLQCFSVADKSSDPEEVHIVSFCS